ncbi:hypothetical protein M9H77_19686 [Catharanthus roseus]|uniref:Uncharacterized protein n=1 Tax=Catharanthus roseus TaxID=4058 RepID=A0ACC0BBB2_CATRO|nr:hypothetical protein M9H77_19686 [Catharanthus roseus]
MYRDLGYYWLRFAIYIALCLCVGTIFYDIGSTYGSIQARGSMLMFVAAFLTFMAIGGFPSFVEDMKIFTRERLNGHYEVASFVVGNTFSSVPYLLLISLAPGAIAYYLVGLQKGIDHFVYFALMLFACMMLVESLMMIVASIVPDFLMGIITGAGIQGVMILNGGFFRLPDDLPKPFWRYPMYYIAFHRYANQGFYKNEFEGLTFQNEQVGGPAIITGDYILKNFWQVEMGYSKWVDVAIIFGMVILYRAMFLAIIKTAEKVKPMIRAFLARPTKRNEYMFYLVVATLASRTGGAPKPSMVTRSLTAGVTVGDAGRLKKGVHGAATDRSLLGEPPLPGKSGVLPFKEVPSPKIDDMFFDQYPIPKLETGGEEILFRPNWSLNVNDRIIDPRVCSKMLDHKVRPRDRIFTSQISFVELMTYFPIALMQTIIFRRELFFCSQTAVLGASAIVDEKIKKLEEEVHDFGQRKYRDF